jgi:hypothetical protein
MAVCSVAEYTEPRSSRGEGDRRLSALQAAFIAQMAPGHEAGGASAVQCTRVCAAVHVCVWAAVHARVCAALSQARVHLHGTMKPEASPRLVGLIMR